MKMAGMVQTWDVQKIREDFPILSEAVNGHPLTYLDNAATAQKPQAVIDAVSTFYQTSNANVHRGLHALSEKATAQYEATRKKVKKWINAPSDKDVVFVRGTTEAINLVAHGFGSWLKAGDQVLITAMEHHANIVPWQMLRDKIGIELKVIPMDADGNLKLGMFERMLNTNVKLVSVCHASNALGTLNPIKDMISLAHAQDIPVMIDGAQSIVHGRIDVQDLDCDFFAFSAHKLYGPTGIGVLYGKAEWLERLPPYQGGGEMIRSVTFNETTYAPVPYKFEAGTQNLAGVIGLGAAIDYLSKIKWDDACHYEHLLFEYANQTLKEISGIRIIGQADNKVPVISFVLEDAHPHDVGTILDHSGIAVRAGHHCAQPVMQFYGVSATVRMSLSFYNTTEEIDRMVAALRHVKEMFA
jgi:cysteine desulfurase/selenocysteine lyase